MDLFGLGGLLAYIKTFNVSNKTTAIFFRICILSGPIYLVALVVYSFRLYNPFQIFVQVSAGLFFCWIIYKASNGFTGIVGKVMEFRPLLYIGKISYGIYLYHYFVPSIISDHFKQLDAIINNSTELQALTYSITTIIIATASWHLIEKPVMALKEKYNKIQLHNSIASNRLLNTDRLTNLSD
jgi:peptidoglycan/LPS O-acetylase OafA/YrhL